MSEWSGMLKDLFRQIDDGSIDLREMRAFLEHRNPFDPVTDWQNFYREVFGIEANFSNLKIPDKKEEFGRLIIVAQGMTPQRLYDKSRELFPCSGVISTKSLNETVKSERNSETGNYAVWFRDTVEADEELENLSANDLKKRGIPGITLEERFLMELQHFKKTGEHLDLHSTTLCSGSRFPLDDVPSVSWSLDGLMVGLYPPGFHHVYVCSRRAVL